MSNRFVRYGRTRRRKKQTIAKLAVVWVISTSIAGPLFILNMMESSHSDNELAVFKVRRMMMKMVTNMMTMMKMMTNMMTKMTMFMMMGMTITLIM